MTDVRTYGRRDAVRANVSYLSTLFLDFSPNFPHPLLDIHSYCQRKKPRLLKSFSVSDITGLAQTMKLELRPVYHGPYAPIPPIMSSLQHLLFYKVQCLSACFCQELDVLSKKRKSDHQYFVNHRRRRPRDLDQLTTSQNRLNTSQSQFYTT